MDLIISLDTEDFITPAAREAQLWWAHTLSEYGVRGNFQIVGELLRTYERSGRTDIIEALRPHEIGYHTDYHSVPPLHPVALEGVPLDSAVSWVLEREARGFADLVRLFGRVPVSYCPPGCSWTPATLLAMASLGVKVWADADRFLDAGWYCGLLGTEYTLAFEDYYAVRPEGEVEADQRFYADIQRLIDGGREVATVMTHPTALVTTRYWDSIFAHHVSVPPEQYPPTPLRTTTEISRIKEQVRRRLQWILANPDLHIIDFSTYYQQYGKARRDLDQLLEEAALPPGGAGMLPIDPAREPADASGLTVDTFTYEWQIFPVGFTGDQLLDQIRGLQWTFSPARK